MDPHHLVPSLSAAVTLLESRAPYASGYARRDSGTNIRVDSVSTSCQPVAPNAGFTLTAWTGSRFLEASCDELDPAAVERVAQRLVERIAAVGVERGGPELDPGERLERHFAQTMAVDSRMVPAADKVEFARALRARLALGADRLIQSIALIGDVHSEICFVNRERRLSQELHRVRQIAVGVFGDGTHQASLHGGFERIGGWEQQAAADGADHPYLAELCRDGPRVLGAARLPDPGEHDCVFSGEFSGIFAHEAFGHGTEQDMFLKDRAKGAEFLGKPVASPLVRMYDDPANGWAASYFFDDEGVLAVPTEIIRDGVLTHGINDRYSAAVLTHGGNPVAKTANGRREAYDHKPYTRMTNTFFGAGDQTVEAMIASISHGYY
ncbi:MAG: TldD/PmbA family protein, partial [Planctomycetes bacterium]|nr:TldD/PmbA family protein [Planctomycetota bacterium]